MALTLNDVTRIAHLARLELAEGEAQQTLGQLNLQALSGATILVIVRGEKGLVALCLRGDHEVNETKAAKLPELPGESVLADESEIWKAIQCKPGFIGPVKLPADMPVIVDRDAAQLADFVCGGGQAAKALAGRGYEP